MEQTLQIKVDTLHDAQRTVYNDPARFKVLDCGRRFGKTALAKRAVVDTTLKRGLPVGVFAPTYKNISEVWRSLRETLKPVTVERSEQEKYLKVVTGGTVECWSLDNIDSLRGRKYALAITDEAAMIRNPEYFDAVIRPTLADYRGGAWFLSTPRGRNHFWQMFQWGLQEFDGQWKSFHYPTSANPHIPKDEIATAERQMPDRLFKQEYLAEFLDDGGGVFRNVRGCIYGLMNENPQAGPEYVFGVDLGKQNDFTVIVVIDVATCRLVYYEAFNQIDYTVQLNRLKALSDRLKPSCVVIERNIGEMFIEQAERLELPVVAFQTTNASKQVLIDSLALAFEQNLISIPNDTRLIAELEGYEMERLPGGTFRYSAPQGMHDDMVIATALAWYGTSIDTSMSIEPASNNFMDMWLGRNA